MKNQFYRLFCGLLLFLFLTSPFKFFAQSSLPSNLYFVAATGSNFLTEKNLSNSVFMYTSGLDTYTPWDNNGFTKNIIIKSNSVLGSISSKHFDIGPFAFC